MKHALRMLACQAGRGSPAPRTELLIDDCELAWTATSGFMRTISSAPTAGGTGYTMGDILNVTTGGTGGQVQVTGVSAGVVTAVANYAGGYGGYTTGAGKVTTGGTGTGCTINVSAIWGASASRWAGYFHDGAYSVRASLDIVPPRSLTMRHALASTLDLSAYSQLRLWLDRDSASMPAGQVVFCLCSDTLGRDVVDQFLLPAVTDTGWIELTLPRVGGGQCSAAARSVAVYLDAAPGFGGPFYFDTIRAAL